MNTVAADTHALLWFLENDRRLPKNADNALSGASTILIPTICLVEITYLIEKGRLQAAVIARILSELDRPATTLKLADLDLGVSRALQQIPRSVVPDLPDRIIAATAYFHCVPLVTCDSRIRSCGIDTVW